MLRNRLADLFSHRTLKEWLAGFRSATPQLPEKRPPHTHVVLLDGTMSSLRPGCETNIGATYRVLTALPDAAHVTVYYEPGIQWRGWRRAHEVMAGVGTNRQIKRAYFFLARNYRPGDRIMLMGYSRGAYAVRSLAGLIDKMGLLRHAHVSPDVLDRLYDLYRTGSDGIEARALRDTRCHDSIRIDFLGVYDTVRALGIRWPVIWRFMPMPHPFHSHELGPATHLARHALALDETRDVYAPVLWSTTPEQAATGGVVQMWFRGTHGDVGGQIDGQEATRPLSNVSLHWMLAEAATAGLDLPEDWQAQYPADPTAPSIGTLRGFGKLFWSRRRRKIGLDPSERLHGSARLSPRSKGIDLPVGTADLGSGDLGPGDAPTFAQANTSAG